MAVMGLSLLVGGARPVPGAWADIDAMSSFENLGTPVQLDATSDAVCQF